jgi:hypothetical protein
MALWKITKSNELKAMSAGPGFEPGTFGLGKPGECGTILKFSPLNPHSWRTWGIAWRKMMRLAGLEPAAHGLGNLKGTVKPNPAVSDLYLKSSRRILNCRGGNSLLLLICDCDMRTKRLLIQAPFRNFC